MGDGDGGLPSLADTIAAVRRELGSAQAPGLGDPVQLRTGPVELDFEVAVTRTGDGPGGVQVGVLTLGGKGGLAVAATQRVRVTLQPLVPEAGQGAQVSGLRREPGVVASQALAGRVPPERPVRAEGLEVHEVDDGAASNRQSFRFGSILVITYGRSGSTLLQGILNSIDGILIRGENHNFCYGLYLAYKSLLQTINQPWIGDTGETPESAWFGCQEFDAETFLEGIQVTLRKLLLGGKDYAAGGIRCYGFKEIRYIEVDDQELLGYLRFLAQIFPNPGFIFLTRDHRQVANSAWWRGQDPLVVERELLRGSAIQGVLGRQG